MINNQRTVTKTIDPTGIKMLEKKIMINCDMRLNTTYTLTKPPIAMAGQPELAWISASLTHLHAGRGFDSHSRYCVFH